MYPSLFGRARLCASLWKRQSSTAVGVRHLCSSTSSSSPSSWKPTVASPQHVDYCRDLVQRYDRPNYLCGLMLPKEMRPAHFAIRAFNIETAQAADVASKPELAQMRLQFWRESVVSMFQGQPTDHPVMQVLSVACSRFNLSKPAFLRVLTARLEDLASAQPMDIADLEHYGELTQASLLQLILEAGGISTRGELRDPISALGRCMGLVTTLRGIPFHASRRRSYFPRQLHAKHEISTEDLFLCKGELVVELTKELAAKAYDHLLQCRDYRRSVSALNDPLISKVMLPAVYCEDYLQQLREANFNVFSPQIQSSTPIRLPLRIWWSSQRNRF
mmetsp:Transcript_47311/g.119150  ORF Transcript_47311/g.119150 Transcript_47311/m.119150 type:complete len:332 (+) Transcript_47311:70-1065(+)